MNMTASQAVECFLRMGVGAYETPAAMANGLFKRLEIEGYAIVKASAPSRIVSMTNPMQEQIDRVWIAIERELQHLGDADIRAGLAWIDPPEQEAIALAAINAMKELNP